MSRVAPSAPTDAAHPSERGQRLAFLDWGRGLAAAVMLQGHVFHSFASPQAQTGGAYLLSQFLGGLAPALFLFLTGVTFAFLLDSRERQGCSGRERWRAALLRAGYLMLLAALFRLQVWISAWGQSSFDTVWKVDILNCMGFGLATLSFLAFFHRTNRIRWSILSGCLIAAAAPWISESGAGPWPLLNHYLVADYNYFAFFPWAAFLAFGVGFGSLLRVIPSQDLERSMQWTALTGFALTSAGSAFSNLPSIYAKSDFWLDSPGLIVIKLGVILQIIAVAYLWTAINGAHTFSWVRLLGTNSLLVYWVHIELVYGRWLAPFKHNLSAPQTALSAIIMISLMVGVCLIKNRLKTWWAARRMPDLLPVSR